MSESPLSSVTDPSTRTEEIWRRGGEGADETAFRTFHGIVTFGNEYFPLDKPSYNVSILEFEVVAVVDAADPQGPTRVVRVEVLVGVEDPPGSGDN